MKHRILVIVALLISYSGFAKLWLPSIFSDDMVLQQQSDITIWGWTTATQETITAYGSWNNEKVSVKAHQGQWSLQLPTPKWGGPYTLTVDGHEKIVFHNLMIGEVWIGSGQSNMEWTPRRGLLNVEQELAEFTIAGEDRIFHPAEAKIKGSTVTVSAKEVKRPEAVRFAFTNAALPNLFNAEGLPASAFRTDDWPVETAVPQSKN